MDLLINTNFWCSRSGGIYSHFISEIRSVHIEILLCLKRVARNEELNRLIFDWRMGKMQQLYIL